MAEQEALRVNSIDRGHFNKVESVTGALDSHDGLGAATEEKASHMSQTCSTHVPDMSHTCTIKAKGNGALGSHDGLGFGVRGAWTEIVGGYNLRTRGAGAAILGSHDEMAQR